MKKQRKKILGIFLVVAMLVVGYHNTASAAEIPEVYSVNRIYEVPDYDNPDTEWFVIDGNMTIRSTPSLSSCSIGISCSSAGLQVSFYTHCTHTSEEIGIRDVKIQKKVGIFWTTVATSAGGSCGDTGVYGGSLLYTNAVYGETYRVIGVHFAYCGGYDLQLENVTGGVKFTY